MQRMLEQVADKQSVIFILGLDETTSDDLVSRPWVATGTPARNPTALPALPTADGTIEAGTGDFAPAAG